MSSEAKPRIIVLIAQFYPVVGGGETHALRLCAGLRADGYDVSVLTRRSRPDLPIDDCIQGVPVRRLPVGGSPRSGKYRMLLPVLRELIRRRDRYDILYVCAPRVLGMAAVPAARWTGKRCILRPEARGEISGGFIWNAFQADRVRVPRGLLRGLLAIRNRIFRQADAFLSISGAIRDELLACGMPEDRIVSIPNGIDIQRFAPSPDDAARAALRQRLGLPADRRLVMYSGKLIRGKGLDTLLHAWRDIASESADTHLVLVGGGGDHSLSCEDTLRSYVTNHALDGRVTFTGYVEAVQDYLRCADVYVFASEKEAFGLAPLEAMACGVPVVVTPVGELPDLIETHENGCMAPVGSVSALRDAIRWLLTHRDEAARLAEAGRQTVVTGYAMETTVRKHEALFASLMERA